jgi:Helix-turn-helix domain
MGVMTIPQPNPYVTLDQPTEAEAAITDHKRARQRRPLPPQEVRDWMNASETALALGCSVATVHRLRRGLIPGVEPLPCSQYGRKCVFRKVSITLWQENNEKRGRL